MKRVCSAILAAVLFISAAATAFAATGQKIRLVKVGEQEGAAFSLSVDPSSDGAVYSSGIPQLYTFGPEVALDGQTGGRTAQIAINPRKMDASGKVVSENYKITWLAVQALTPNVTASVTRNDGTLMEGKQAPVLTLQANSGVDECEPADYLVTIDMTIGEVSGKKLVNKKNISVTLKGEKSAAYSKGREVNNGDVYRVSEEEGSVFHLDMELSESTKINCNNQTAVLFQGDYHDAWINMNVSTDPIKEVEKKFSDASVQYTNFVGAPQLYSEAAVTISGPQEAFIYAYDQESGAISKVATTYENNKHLFKTKNLGCYFLSDKDYQGG